MGSKHGIIGEVIMWSFMGALAVLFITKSSGFSTAVGTVVQPLEYETSVIATAGGSSVGKQTNLPK